MKTMNVTAPEAGVRVLNISLDPTYLENSDAVPGDIIERTRSYASIVQGYDVLVYAPKGAGKPRADMGDNVRIHPVRSWSKWLFPINAYRMGVQTCQKHKPDLIHAQDVFSAGLVGYMLKKRFNLPLCFGFHGDTLNNPHWLRERLLNRILNRLGKWLLPRGDAIQVPSTLIKEKLVGFGVPSNKLWHHVLPCDLQPFQNVDGSDVRETLIKNRFTQIAVFAGRLVDQKDLPTLLSAMVIVNNSLDGRVGLVIVGDGDRRSHLETMTRKLGIQDNTIFVGRLEHDQVPAYMAAADVVVMSSVYEGNSRVPMEAAACGIPVVATDISGTRDTIIDRVTGLVVPPQDPDRLAQALITVLNNPEKARQMGLAARNHVVPMYSMKAVVPHYKEMWETTVRRYLSD